MKFYADTSLLFSYYGSDAHSPRSDAWRQSNPVALPFTPLHRLELRNAFQLAVFQQRLTAVEATQAWLLVENDLREGYLHQSEPPLADAFREADILASQYTAQIGARSLDVLHLGVAKLLGVEELATFDLRQAKLGLQIGLKMATI